MPGQLILAMPLYTHVSTAWFVNYEMLDKRHVVDVLIVRKLYLAAAMTNLFNSALGLSADWDRLVVLEADIMPPVDALNRIAEYPDHLDVVGAMYFQHSPPHQPIVYNQVTDDTFKALGANQVEHVMARPGVHRVDAVGFGFTSIHRRVLQDWPQGVMFGGETELGHDLWFCRAARRAGFGVHVDTAICPGTGVGHLTEIPITYEHTKT